MAEDSERLKELFALFGPVRVRSMFGGAGLYADDLMFAQVADGQVYLKADAETCRAFRDEGCGPFVYGGKGKPLTMSYWRLPDRLYDDPEELAEWAGRALAVARRSRR